MDRFAASAERASEILDQLDAERLERLLEAADRTARLLERIDAEIGFERASEVFDGLRSLAETADQMNRSLRTLEQLAAEMRRLVAGPLARLPIPGRFRPGGEHAAR